MAPPPAPGAAGGLALQTAPGAAPLLGPAPRPLQEGGKHLSAILRKEQEMEGAGWSGSLTRPAA